MTEPQRPATVIPDPQGFTVMLPEGVISAVVDWEPGTHPRLFVYSDPDGNHVLAAFDLTPNGAVPMVPGWDRTKVDN